MTSIRDDARPSPTYLQYLASVSFFPTVLAGPITRVSSLIPQWNWKGVVLTGEEGSRALFLIGLGLAKKFLIADYLGNNLVNRVFDLPTLYSGGDVLVAVYAYAFQLYYDFSGYSDIAIGAGLLLGIRLPVNFNAPYRALNIADFWRRWHISFSNWLRDYLYFSLPGPRTRGDAVRRTSSITMAIGGLWHGLSWTFLIWGLLHGIGLAGFRLWQVLTKNQVRTDNPIRRVAGSAADLPFRPAGLDLFPRPERRHRAEGYQPNRPLPLRLRQHHSGIPPRAAARHRRTFHPEILVRRRASSDSPVHPRSSSQPPWLCW